MSAVHERTGIPERRVRSMVADLLTAGAVVRRGRRLVASATVDDGVEAVATLQIRRSQLAESRTAMLRRYLEVPRCRWRALLSYFGEVRDELDDADGGVADGRPDTGWCGHCDVCDSGADGPEATSDTEPSEDPGTFRAGLAVRHTTFGPGTVVDRADGELTVLFDDAGYRVLSEELAADGLLEPQGEPVP